jgi:hypothetical protein
MKVATKTACAVVALGLAILISGCSSTTVTPEALPTGAQFESDNPDANVFTDDAGNELQVGDDLPLPADWPVGVPTPVGKLIAVSVVDSSTAVATWQIEGDMLIVEANYVAELEKAGFAATQSTDLSTDTISVYTAMGNGLDITISATLGAESTDPSELTVLINPAM